MHTCILYAVCMHKVHIYIHSFSYTIEVFCCRRYSEELDQVGMDHIYVYSVCMCKISMYIHVQFHCLPMNSALRTMSDDLQTSIKATIGSLLWSSLLNKSLMCEDMICKLAAHASWTTLQMWFICDVHWHSASGSTAENLLLKPFCPFEWPHLLSILLPKSCSRMDIYVCMYKSWPMIDERWDLACITCAMTTL